MGKMYSLDRRMWLGRWRSLELLLLLLLILMVVVVVLLMVHPWGGAIGVMRETVTSLWHCVNGPQGEGLACLMGARTLWTTGPHALEGLSLALGLLVREGGVGRVGGTEHTAEGGGLGAGQGAHRSDRGGGTVLVKGSLGVNRTFLGPE